MDCNDPSEFGAGGSLLHTRTQSPIRDGRRRTAAGRGKALAASGYNSTRHALDVLAAVKLHCEGETYRGIAERLSVGVATAHAWVYEALYSPKALAEQQERREREAREDAWLRRRLTGGGANGVQPSWQEIAVESGVSWQAVRAGTDRAFKRLQDSLREEAG